MYIYVYKSYVAISYMYISEISYSYNIHVLIIRKIKKVWKHTQDIQALFTALPFFGFRCHGPLHSGEASAQRMFHVCGKPENLIKFSHPTKKAAPGDLAEYRLTKAVANNLNEGNIEHRTRRSHVSSCITLVGQFSLTKERHCEPFTLTCWYLLCGFR